MSRIKSIFGEYATELQAIVDTNLDAFKEIEYPRFFRMGNPTVNLTYATAIGTSRIEAAASVVANGAEAPLRTRANLQKLTGEVPAIKVKRRLQEEEYRNWLVLDSLRTPDQTNVQQIINLIFEDLQYCKTSVDKRIDHMVAQALSKGKISINATTNPDGIVPGDIDLLVDKKWASNTAFNFDNADKHWTDANRTTALPITNIQYLTRKMWKDYGVRLEYMICTSEMLWILLNNAQVQAHLKGSFGIVSGQDALFALPSLNALLASQQLPTIQLFDVKTAIESNGVLSTVEPWEDKKYVTFVPSLNLGKIHNAYDIEELNPVNGVDYATAGRVLLSKWSETEPFGEYTRGSMAAFPGLEVADQMVIVNTDHRTVF